MIAPRWRSGVDGVLRAGVLRNPWILPGAELRPAPGPRSHLAARGRFLLDYIDPVRLNGFTTKRPGTAPSPETAQGTSGGHDRWVINKVRALAYGQVEGARKRLPSPDCQQRGIARRTCRKSSSCFLRRFRSRLPDGVVHAVFESS